MANTNIKESRISHLTNHTSKIFLTSHEKKKKRAAVIISTLVPLETPSTQLHQKKKETWYSSQQISCKQPEKIGQTYFHMEKPIQATNKYRGQSRSQRIG